jgi:uncharacterized protein YkwD
LTGSVAIALFATLTWAPTAMAADAEPSLSDVEEQIFVAVNAHRAAAGLPELELDADVANIARAHSEAMARGEISFGHANLKTRTGRIMALRPIGAVAENISSHTRKPSAVAEKALENWLASDVQRVNIENDHQLTGVGAAVSEDGTVFLTQIFVRTR